MMVMFMVMLMVFLTLLEHDVEGLDLATVVTMLESNIMRPTAGGLRENIIIKIKIKIKIKNIVIIYYHYQHHAAYCS